VFLIRKSSDAQLDQAGRFLNGLLLGSAGGFGAGGSAFRGGSASPGRTGRRGIDTSTPGNAGSGASGGTPQRRAAVGRALGLHSSSTPASSSGTGVRTTWRGASKRIVTRVRRAKRIVF